VKIVFALRGKRAVRLEERRGVIGTVFQKNRGGKKEIGKEKGMTFVGHSKNNRG